MITSRLVRPLLALAALAATALPAAAAGQVEVTFVDPDSYTDIGLAGYQRERSLKILDTYLRSLGRGLPDGQTLKIEVIDVDLAGNLEPFGIHPYLETRVQRDRSDWPRLNLDYTLSADGQATKTGSVRLTDISYLYALRGSNRAAEEMLYEKSMIKRWFDATFVAP
jgi:hypothetical protein